MSFILASFESALSVATWDTSPPKVFRKFRNASDCCSEVSGKFFRNDAESFSEAYGIVFRNGTETFSEAYGKIFRNGAESLVELRKRVKCTTKVG